MGTYSKVNGKNFPISSPVEMKAAHIRFCLLMLSHIVKPYCNSMSMTMSIVLYRITANAYELVVALYNPAVRLKPLANSKAITNACRHVVQCRCVVLVLYRLSGAALGKRWFASSGPALHAPTTCQVCKSKQPPSSLMPPPRAGSAMASITVVHSSMKLQHDIDSVETFLAYPHLLFTAWADSLPLP